LNHLSSTSSPKTVLALDPSKSATGWVVIRDEKVIGYECFKFVHSVPKTAGTIARHDEFYDAYVPFLMGLVRTYWVNEIVAEFPHGSQSANASSALSMVRSIIAAVGRLMDVPVYFYLESQAKKHYYGTSKGIEKQKTIDEMSAKFADYGYEKMNIKFRDEAVSDALLVACKHLDL
jgi:Holliday junction resolvasome RuvABC endonuclease subunit